MELPLRLVAADPLREGRGGVSPTDSAAGTISIPTNELTPISIRIVVVGPLVQGCKSCPSDRSVIN